MAQTLPPRADLASEDTALAEPVLNPFLLAASAENHTLELTAALQKQGVPCLLAFTDRMLEYWRREARPSAVIVDMGLDWTRRPAEQLISQGTAVVGLSDDEEKRMWAVGQGFEDAFALSMNPQEIATKLRSRFLFRDSLSAASPEEDGPLRMDLAQRRVWWCENERHLPPKQFDLLACLASRAGTMVKIDTLLRLVWREAWGDPNKVAKMIGRIRKALGEDASGYIVSEDGYYGYRPR
jgi:DNA-binding response OmpR family regulator